LREGLIALSSNPRSVTVVTFASGDVLLNSFQNTERKRKPFEGLFTAGRFKNQKRKFLSLLARRPVPFIRIRRIM
jgi:hypothetical protein